VGHRAGARRWPVGRPLVGSLGRGLSEVRTTFDKNEYRVFFYIEHDEVIVVHGTVVLVHGIHKKTQKTPAADLDLARRRMKEGT
jgi:phage-related protein